MQTRQESSLFPGTNPACDVLPIHLGPPVSIRLFLLAVLMVPSLGCGLVLGCRTGTGITSIRSYGVDTILQVVAPIQWSH